MNQFENTGAAVVLPKLTGGSYDALLRAERQLREDQRWQDRQRADAEKFNYDVFQDMAKNNLSGLDSIHRQATHDAWQGFLNNSALAIKEANKAGRKVDYTQLGDQRQTVLGLQKKAAAHQQEMGLLAETLNADKNGIYKPQLYNDALKKGFVTDEYGRINPNQFNTGYETGSIQAMLQDPKYKNAEAMLDSYVKSQGQGLSTRYSSYRDRTTGEFFDQEDKFEYNTAVYGDDIEWDDDGRPVVKDAKAFMLDLKGNDPDTFETLQYQAQQDGTSVLSKVQDFLNQQGLTPKGGGRSRVAQTRPTNTSNEKEYTFTVAQGGSGEFQDGVKNYEGDAIPMSQFIKNVTISDGGQSKSMDFEGFYINPETKQPSFKFTTSDTYNARELNDIFVDLNDEETIAKLRNQLPEGSAKRKAFDKAFNEAKALESRETGFNDDKIKSDTTQIVDMVRDAKFDEAVAKLNELGLNDVTIEESGFFNPNSHQIVIDGKKYRTNSDKDQIISLLQNKLRQGSSATPATADEL